MKMLNFLILSKCGVLQVVASTDGGTCILMKSYKKTDSSSSVTKSYANVVMLKRPI